MIIINTFVLRQQNNVQIIYYEAFYFNEYKHNDISHISMTLDTTFTKTMCDAKLLLCFFCITKHLLNVSIFRLI